MANVVADKINLLNLSRLAMESFVIELGEPAYRAQQLVQWIHQYGVTDFHQMTNLSKSLRERLEAVATIETMQVAFRQISKDETQKWLFRLHDGNAIETVYIPERGRGTLCVSSQVGCALNCSFCSTGKEGFNRNLSLAEVIGQVWMAVRELSSAGSAKNRVITNVVMMGMGEPLLNYDVVVAALDYMLCDFAYGLSKYRVTVSTSGVVPAMQRLREDTAVSLAVSLHAANNALRNELVPLNKKYPLEVLIPLCRDYFPSASKREVTYEYVMLEGINDQPEHAKQLVKLLGSRPGKVNLIPFNPFPQTRYHTSKPQVIQQFSEYLQRAGINTRSRKTRGEDIDAACGQLAGQIQDRTGRHERWKRTGRLVPIS